MEPRHNWLLSAAEGWLDLGLEEEAEREWENLPSDVQGSLRGSEVAWRIHAKRRQWEDALALSRKELDRYPDNVSPWLRLAFALRRARPQEVGVIEAQKVLLQVARKFPKEPVVAYNLACYACQLGAPEKAIEWLRRAIKLGDRSTILAMARADSDLVSMRDQLDAL